MLAEPTRTGDETEERDKRPYSLLALLGALDLALVEPFTIPPRALSVFCSKSGREVGLQLRSSR